MWVCGFGFKAPPDAACHLVSPQFLLAVPAGMDAAVASLVMPAAMLRFGLERAASTIAPASIVVSPSPISDFAELCAREWLSPRAEGPTLVVELSARVADAERSFASFEATHREVRGLWIQSAPSDPPPEPRLRSDAARLTIVPIPDPWSTWNLDVLSEDALESPPWATPERLERTLEWLRGHQEVVTRTLPRHAFHRPAGDVSCDVVPTAPTRLRSRRARPIGVSVIGAGEFAPFLLKYVLRERDVVLRGIVDLQPTRARFIADLYGFAFCSTRETSVFDDGRTDCVFIVTDHQSHARLAAAALEAGKFVFVEKPPAIDHEQLRALLEAAATSSGTLQVGYNRLFAPLVVRLRTLVDRESGPARIRISRRPYDVSRNSWYYWPKEGTRIVSNVCHFLDLSYHVAQRARPLCVSAVWDGRGRMDENVSVTATFDDGSVAVIRFARDADEEECVAVQRGAASIRMCGYSRLQAFDAGGRQTGDWTTPADLGHAAEVAAFFDSYRERRSGVHASGDLLATSLLTFAARDSLFAGRPVAVPLERFLEFGVA